ncbi:MAG TPA: FKBP-type peptidyl-prolyl cis-trans isomerase [Candidatus Saccharibacteria bacterium]|nr:FKBP-type peptidyl-prolyl cis-trans isomerase [Candidatus Saccharibacteria bacterium]HRK94459.1 FKBP-type peptidyl-prolyl cis-trans isomerase [Candidatus Saccharibacteria bacterium]
MATSTAQRTGIWIIAIVLTVGTIAGFVAMILAPQNEAADTARVEEQYAKYQKELNAATEKQTAQTTALEKEASALSSKYYKQFSAYQKNVGKFDHDKAQTKLVKEDLKAGTGETITDDTSYAVYYIGWLPNGTIFDGSIDGKKLKTPFVARPSGTISGWAEGAKGMKIGGVRMLTIPSEQGYGATGQGDIPANTPLRFVLMPIRVVETIKQPEVPAELLQSYGG